MTKANWEKNTGLSENFILQCDGFHVSYNPNTQSGVLGGLFAGSSPQETALCKDGVYYVLNGDWRTEFEKAAPKGWNMCMTLYEKLAEQHCSPWSLQ